MTIRVVRILSDNCACGHHWHLWNCRCGCSIAEADVDTVSMGGSIGNALCWSPMINEPMQTYTKDLGRWLSSESEEEPVDSPLPSGA